MTKGAMAGQAPRHVSGTSPLEAKNMALMARVEELEQLVLRDTLTPLYNRRHFMETLDRWIWRAHRYDAECGLLFIDVDQLKNVNDMLGHQAGDQLLISIAATLQSCFRRSDIVARISGDEFGVLMEQIEPESLSSKAEKISHVVASQPLEYEGRKIARSISIGYAEIDTNTSPAELLKRADRAMYADKLKKQTGANLRPDPAVRS